MEVAEGARCPAGYGLAYWELDRRVGIFYPIPFHWVVRVARSMWWAFKTPQARLNVEKAWAKGYAAEMADSYKMGLEDGRKDENKRWLAILDEQLSHRPDA